MSNLRVEQHLINPSHNIFQLVDDYSFKSKNLYNHANYFVRQTFIITSRINENKHLHPEQENFIQWLNLKVDEYNIYKQEYLIKQQKQGKKLKKQFKKLEYFNSKNKYLGYEFLNFVTYTTIDYTALMAQVAQQTLRRDDNLV